MMSRLPPLHSQMFRIYLEVGLTHIQQSTVLLKISSSHEVRTPTPPFRNDNAQVYHYMEEATRGTIYAASIKPSQRTKNGRKAWRALVAQYAGKYKWEKELKDCDDFIHTRKWTGAQNYSLEKFVSQHRSSYVSMCQCAEHVDYQLPNELTRVKYLLEAIDNLDPALQAELALVRADEGP